MRTRHDACMEVGDEDGHGRYGVLDEDAAGLLCHECGRRFTHLGLHVYKAHGLTAREYHAAHGLGGRGLVAEATRRTIAENARDRLPLKTSFVQRRDPARATAARLGAGSVISPAGLEALRRASTARRGQQRLGTVVVCGWCAVEFCPLVAAKKRRFCSRSCASRRTRALDRLDPERMAPGGGITLPIRPRRRPSWSGGRLPDGGQLTQREPG